MIMSRLRNKKGLTLVEVQFSIILLSVIFLGIFGLYNASRVFYFAANEKIIISYELQGAVEHIYKYTMQAIGDEAAAPNSRPIEVPDAETLNITINNNDPLTQSNYGTTVTYSYSKSGDELMFDNGVDPAESMAPKVTITDVTFALDGNLLTISLTGQYNDRELIFYSACYPRLASFQ